MPSVNLSCILGLHIGVSSRHVAIIEPSGKVLFRNYIEGCQQERSFSEYKNLLKDACEAIQSLVKQAESQGIKRQAIVGGGVVVPGSVDPRHGFVRKSPNLRGLSDRQLARDLADALKDTFGRAIPFYVENDGNGAALAEAHFGAGRGESEFVAVMLCTGLGGGVFVDGKLYRGHTSMAGEIGHTTVHPNGPLCSCGSKGCLETLASGRALMKAARDSTSPLADRENLCYADLVKAAEENDGEIVEIYRTMGVYLGIGLANVINTLNPSKVVLSAQCKGRNEDASLCGNGL